MNKKVFMITQEGFDKLVKELDYLQHERRKEIAQKIREAKEFGDLSENAEYHEAKTDQAFVESQIVDLEAKIKNSKVIDKVTSGTHIQIGSTVEVKNLETKENMTLDIVGSMEADVFNNKISNESPLGGALLEKKKGDKITYTAPKGQMKFEVIKIK